MRGDRHGPPMRENRTFEKDLFADSDRILGMGGVCLQYRRPFPLWLALGYLKPEVIEARPWPEQRERGVECLVGWRTMGSKA